MAIKILKQNKVQMLVLSSEKNDVVKLRCQKIGVNYKNGVDNKIKYPKILFLQKWY